MVVDDKAWRVYVRTLVHGYPESCVRSTRIGRMSSLDQLSGLEPAQFMCAVHAPSDAAAACRELPLSGAACGSADDDPPVRGAQRGLPDGAVAQVVRLDFDGPAARNLRLCDPNRLGPMMCILTTTAAVAWLAPRCGALVADATPATDAVS